MRDVAALTQRWIPERASELQGHDDSAIDAFERARGRRLPAAVRSFARALGKNTGALSFTVGMKDIFGDGTRDASALFDCLASEHGITPSATLFPFASVTDDGDGECWWIDLAAGDDPPVFGAGNGFGTTAAPAIVAPTFTAWIRERILRDVEEEHANVEPAQWTRYPKPFSERDVTNLRREVIANVARADAARGTVTTTLQFQALWLERYRRTPLFEALQGTGRYVPWSWVDLPARKPQSPVVGLDA